MQLKNITKQQLISLLSTLTLQCASSHMTLLYFPSIGHSISYQFYIYYHSMKGADPTCISGPISTITGVNLCSYSQMLLQLWFFWDKLQVVCSRSILSRSMLLCVCGQHRKWSLSFATSKLSSISLIRSAPHVRTSCCS